VVLIPLILALLVWIRIYSGRRPSGLDVPNETPPALYETPEKQLPITIVRIDSRVNLTVPLNSCVSEGDLIGYQAPVSEPDEDGAPTPPRLEPAPVTAPSDGKLVLLDAAGSAFGLVSGGAHACD
jgi:hypothetical protein